MVVAARLDWLRRQALGGTAMQIRISPTADPHKSKVRFILHPKELAMRLECRQIMVATLDAVALIAHASVAVDRGHSHSDGAKEVSLWMPKAPTGGNTTIRSNTGTVL